MGARVPVLKYKCALSGLDCDISIQGSGALVKANFMAVLNQHCPALSPLYRYRVGGCWVVMVGLSAHTCLRTLTASDDSSSSTAPHVMLG